MSIQAYIPRNEEQRLKLIHDLGVVQHFQNDELFQKITVLAAEFFKCPMALITIIDVTKIWFLSSVGVEGVTEGIRDLSICQYTILPETEDVFVVPDAAADPRFAASPLITNANVHFYAAAPIRLEDIKIGTFVILDTVPRYDFNEEKVKKLLELGNTVSDMIFEKKVEFLQEENMTMDIVQNSYKDILSELQAMIRVQSELSHLNRLVYQNKKSRSNKLDDSQEITANFEKLKGDLFEKRHAIQNTLHQSLKSIDRLKSNAVRKRSNSAGKPILSQVRGDYLQPKEWFGKLQQITMKAIPNYGMFTNNVKWEFKIGNEYELNDGSMDFLGTLLSLLMICQLQKWKYLKISFSTFVENDNGNSPRSPSGQKSILTKKSTKKQINLTSIAEDQGNNSGKNKNMKTSCNADMQQNSFYMVTGKLCIEVKGSCKLVKNISEFPLFPEENQFFSICDNFISNGFQIIQGEYQKYNNRSDEIANFWLVCYMKDNVISPSLPCAINTNVNATSSNAYSPGRAKLGQKTSSFWNMSINKSINNFLNNDWFYRNASRKDGTNNASRKDSFGFTLKNSSKSYHAANSESNDSRPPGVPSMPSVQEICLKDETPNAGLQKNEVMEVLSVSSNKKSVAIAEKESADNTDTKTVPEINSLDERDSSSTKKEKKAESPARSTTTRLLENNNAVNSPSESKKMKPTTTSPSSPNNEADSNDKILSNTINSVPKVKAPTSRTSSPTMISSISNFFFPNANNNNKVCAAGGDQ